MDERSAHRRSTSVKKVPPYRNKRILAIAAAVLTFGTFVTVTQVSNAGTRRGRPAALPACPPATAGGTAQQPGTSAGTATPYSTWQNGRRVNVYPDDAGDPRTNIRRGRPGSRPTCRPTNNTGTPTGSTGATPSTSSSSPPALQVLGQDCSESRLPAHTGFQEGGRCVSSSHGEVSLPENSPSLLITSVIVNGQRRAVTDDIVVGVNATFEVEVSTRNLVRDRFLGAAAGGYYLESSFLNADGLQRGHFHFACNVLQRTDEAPDMAPVPAFFVAVEDGGGGKEPDRVRVAVRGIPTAGNVQCAAWAGDGSHRTPMMTRANQRPAFDTFRMVVR